MSRPPMKDMKGYLTPEQIMKLLSAPISFRDKMLIRLLWATGARVSELLRVKVSDVNWREGILTIITLKRRKAMERMIPLDNKTLKLLKEYIEKYRIGGRLFRITPQRVWQIVRKAGKKVGIVKVGQKKLHPHHLRHSYAIALVKSGCPLRKLQQRLGHVDIKTTAFYLQFSPTELRGEWDKIFEEV